MPFSRMFDLVGKGGTLRSAEPRPVRSGNQHGAQHCAGGDCRPLGNGQAPLANQAKSPIGIPHFRPRPGMTNKCSQAMHAFTGLLYLLLDVGLFAIRAFHQCACVFLWSLAHIASATLLAGGVEIGLPTRSWILYPKLVANRACTE